MPADRVSRGLDPAVSARLVERLLAASGWKRTRRLLHRHPELLGDDAIRLLERKARKAVRADRYEDAAAYVFHRELLLACRRVGIDRAVARLKAAARRLPGVVDLGNAALRRYRATGRLNDLETAVSAFERALRMTVPGQPNRPVVLGNLGLALIDRFGRNHLAADLDRAVALLEEAVRTTDPASAERSAALTNLGIALLAGRHLRTDGAWAHRAVDVLLQAVARTGNDDLERGRNLVNLGIALAERYRWDGDPSDLDRAAQVLEDAAGAADNEPARLANLSAVLAERHTRLGMRADLDRALALIDQAIEQTTHHAAAARADSADLPDWLTNRALILRDQYARDGDLVDLDDAIAQLSDAVELTRRRDGPPAALLDQYATTLRLRALRRHRRDDLQAALEAHRAAADVSTADERCMVLNNLAGTLRSWAAAAEPPERRAALAEALDSYRAALREARTEEDRCAVLTNFGVGLLDRYDEFRARADLDEAVDVLTESVNGTAESSPDLVSRLNNLGNGLRRRHELAGSGPESDHLSDQIVATYRRGCRLAAASATEAGWRCALNWARWAGDQGRLATASEAYNAARSFTDELLAQNLTRNDKEAWLADVGQMSARAAVASSRPRQAAAWLEWGRARLLSDALAHDRSDLAALDQDRPALAARYRAVTAKIRVLELVGNRRR
jgi:hypothetical protein